MTRMNTLDSALGILGVTATRRNHALEHATVAVLLERFGFTRSLAGRSNTEGFHIFGDVSLEEVRGAANEGLERLRNGERSLAISPFCGTNIAVTGVMAGLLTLSLVGRRNRMQQLPNVLIGGIVAVFLGQPIGRFLQKHVTTSADMGNLRIKDISTTGIGPLKALWVATTQS